MRIDLTNRLAVVTGGASGVGEATVRVLAGSGATVVIADVNDAAGRRIADQLPPAIFLKTDVSSDSSVAALFARIHGEFGRLDALVNAAAWLHPAMYRPFLDQPVEEWDRTQEVNFRGVVLTCRRALPLLEVAAGSIVNITSVGSQRVFSNGAAYCSSKAAVEHFTRCLALEYAARGVRVNALAPGYIDTPGVRFATQDRAALKQVIERKIPMGRLGEPEEMAQAVLFLLSPMASYITGATLLADGGWSLT